MHDTRRTRVILGVLLIVALGLMTIDYRGGSSSPLRGLRGAGGAVFGPVERAASAVTRPVTQFFGGIAGAPAAQRKIQALQRENDRLRAQLQTGRLARIDSDQLSRLLRLAGAGGYRIVAANVVAVGLGYEDTVTIDAGAQDGIRDDQTVLDGNGLIGRVTQVAPLTSTVVLATDGTTSVGARLEGSGQIGVVTGMGKGLSGQGMLRFQLLDANTALGPGQRIVTFGSVGGRPYVPGVPIGVITQVENTPGTLTRFALVRPFVQFAALDVVGVVVAPPRRDPRDSVLPPLPGPSPSVPPAGSRPESSNASPGPGG